MQSNPKPTREGYMVELYCFGIRLDKLFSVKSLSETIYLIHNETNYKSFEEEYVLPTMPNLKRAVFEFSGHFNKERPVFNFIKLI